MVRYLLLLIVVAGCGKLDVSESPNAAPVLPKATQDTITVTHDCPVTALPPPVDDEVIPSVAELIDPCNDTDGILDDAIIKLPEGDLLYVSRATHGKKTKRKATFLEPGDYVTSDGTDCEFSVDEEGNITW